MMLRYQIFSRSLVLLFAVFLSFVVHAQEGYPVPAQNPDMLFYLQRSLDMNSVIYAGNYLKKENGKRELNPEEPLQIYWQLNDKAGTTEPLSQIQKLGYGVKSEAVEGGIFKINLVAYNKVKIFLKPAPKTGKYLAYILMDDKEILLSRIFINIDGGSKLAPNVTFIEVTGTDPKNGNRVSQKIFPK